MQNSINSYKVGIDIGSTTAKAVVLNTSGEIVYSEYVRHNADIFVATTNVFKHIQEKFGDASLALTITGSAGMGLCERFTIPFVQEVVATARIAETYFTGVSTVIDIGGEDAKIIYIKKGKPAEMRMNGNCAGGTGAFIDQMSVLLNCSVEAMNTLAQQATSLYPIASRCGVFSKTDVQNLLSKNASKADIAASVFRAVAIQTIATLSHGSTIKPKLLFTGGPLTFIPALRKAFIDYLGLKEDDYISSERSPLIAAWGAADSKNGLRTTAKAICALLANNHSTLQSNRLPAIFNNTDALLRFRQEKQNNTISHLSLSKGKIEAFLGIDSGSTTTKIVLIDTQEHILFSYYASNNGNPLEAAKTGIHTLAKECERVGTQLIIKGSCSTGYGEELVRAALSFNTSIIETIAHFTSAKKINPEVSFILDIGGQDMKAIFIDKGTISRMEINEACSSGCGSFIETFAKSLKYTVEDFASAAALAPNPCDLGTRCTVFMNSKVKQFLREGATVADIAAGLSYSVVKNCLYKVLKLKNISELGKHVVLQGGTMKNDSIVGAFEKLLGFSVYRSNIPELMGAYGCALYAKNHCTTNLDTTLEKMLSVSNYLVKSLRCQGCENKCQINEYKFGNANAYYSGNKCETVFSNNQNGKQKGENIYEQKYQKIFGGETPPMDNPVLTIGIPRVLNLYEEYPFWKELLTNCGIRCQLSDPSSFQAYENVLSTVMSDSICFPAKLVHSHIVNLSTKNIDRIFMPYVVYEMKDGKNETNSYNCPIVSGYSEVIRSSMDQITLPIDSPIVSFKDTLLLKKSCLEYLGSLGIVPKVINIAFDKALKRYKQHQIELRELNLAVYAKAKKENKLIILLAGRPYHTDPLIQHKLSQMIASMGITVISDDIVRGDTSIDLSQDIHHVPQWSYINRILKAAKWVAQQGNEVHFVQMTSFGCGPDAFLIDEIKGILHRYGKSATTLKIDDINNMGSLRLRVRSLVESLKIKAITSKNIEPFVSTKAFGKTEKNRTILVPYFTDYLSPLLPSLLTLAGYQIEVLPPSDAKSVEMGLKYANNEVCYPATLIVGDIMKALFSGKYDRSKIAVIITQTGGQCRASNYIALIKSALVSADFADIPVISLSMGSGLNVNQKGFKINWLKILPITLSAILFGDCISKFYHATVVRERKKGEAALLRTSFLQQAQSFILQNDSPALLNLLAHAAQQFNELAEDKHTKKVGIVGEIFLKFNSFAHKNVVDWLIAQDIEVVPPVLISFFLQSFPNTKARLEHNLQKSDISSLLMDTLYKMIRKKIEEVNQLASTFRFFIPFTDIYQEAQNGSKVISLAAQFGEGWLLPAEIVSFAKADVNNVISLQPFGCIANQVVVKGVENKIKQLYPNMNLLSLDFDSGVSDANIINRLHLMIDDLN